MSTTDRESFVAAIADRPGDEATRLVFADWLEEHGEHTRAELIRTAAQAARARPGSPDRAALLDHAEDLLASHEAEWLGEWRQRLIDWDFKHGFLYRVRLTAANFLRHGEELFRREPVVTVELVNDANDPLAEDDIGAVVSHPAFGFVRDCAVVTNRFGSKIPVHVWLDALAGNDQVTRLRRFGPVGMFPFEYNRDSQGDGIEEQSFAAFCAARHLGTLRSLNLQVNYYQGDRVRPWLVPHLARAVFARQLRNLHLGGFGLSPDGFRQLGTDAVFRKLRNLDLPLREHDVNEWAAIFQSATLTSVRNLNIGANLLPAYARSPMAARIRYLTVNCSDDLDRDTSADVWAWLKLLDHAPPPRRLVLRCHNPGDEVFAAMNRKNWLRAVRELSISGDSQYEVYSGETEGIQSLFGPKSMPRLAKLRLHEACDKATLGALARWPGMNRLDALELTDDYHGRLTIEADEPFQQPARLRTLEGVVLETEEDIQRFFAQFHFDHLSRLKLSFTSEYAGPGTFIPRLTLETMEKVLRSPKLARLTELTLGFHYLVDEARKLIQVLADPSVMPRLKRLSIYSMYDELRPWSSGLQARFGARLDAF